MYEAHITVTPNEILGWERFNRWVKLLHWKVSVFEVDDVDNSEGKWFMSINDKTLEAITRNVSAALKALRGDGYVVNRWKIEQTLLDSKNGDSL